MKYSIAESARIAGVTRKTFYNHIKKKGISVEKDEDGKPRIDASELIRVYNDKCNFEQESGKDTGQISHKDTPVSTQADDIEIAVLKERIAHIESQRDYFKDQYEREREERKNNMLLLTDQREKQEKWEQVLDELRQEIANKEEGALKELNQFKLETKKRLFAYKRALQKERDKSIWQKLFGVKSNSSVC